MRWPWQRDVPPPQTAAVETVTPATARYMRRTRQSWQNRVAWFARNNGAVRFAGGIKADACSRCEIRPEVLVDPRNDTWEPVDTKIDGALVDVIHAYRGRHESTAELIRQHVWNYDTVGEALQCMETDGELVRFAVRSVLHAEWLSNGVLIRDMPGGNLRDGTATFYPTERVKRMWQPNEEWPALATSAMEAVLPDMERYHALARRIRREAESALTGNGLIWTPSEGHHALPPEQRVTGGPQTDIDRAYYETAERALQDDDGPEAVARLSMHWKHEFGPPVPVDLSSKMSSEIIALRQEALESMGRGLDYPQRLFVEGVGSGNHWSDWLLTEQFAKESCAPTLERVCWSDLTSSFFRPALRSLIANGVWNGDPRRYRVGFDISPIVVHPDQSAQAIQLYTIGVLSDTKLLEITGFDPANAPEGDELKRWIDRTKLLHKGGKEQGGGDEPGAVTMGTPALTAGAIDVQSRLVSVGPYASERVGWLDD